MSAAVWDKTAAGSGSTLIPFLTGVAMSYRKKISFICLALLSGLLLPGMALSQECA